TFTNGTTTLRDYTSASTMGDLTSTERSTTIISTAGETLANQNFLSSSPESIAEHLKSTFETEFGETRTDFSYFTSNTESYSNQNNSIFRVRDNETENDYLFYLYF